MAENSSTALEQDILRQQISESRESLVEKLEQLEERVSESVHSATASMAEATASVVETVQNATASVSETVGNVNSAVQGTVENVKNTMSETVQSIKDTFDLSEQVRQHPWPSLVGAVAVGFVAARFLQGDDRPERDHAWDEDGPNHAGWAEYNPTARAAEREARRPGFDQSSAFRSSVADSIPERTAKSPDANIGAPSWLDQLRHTFKGELEKVQGLAIGASLGLIRDMVSQSAPPTLKNQITEILNDMTEKLGGKTITEPILGPSEDRPSGV